MDSSDPSRISSPSTSILQSFGTILVTLLSYEKALIQYIFFDVPYSKGALSKDVPASVQVFSLALIFKMWGRPHYRSRSFQQDMLDNLKNVAIPGTGIPLSVFCHLNVCVCYL